MEVLCQLMGQGRLYMTTRAHQSVLNAAVFLWSLKRIGPLRT